MSLTPITIVGHIYRGVLLLLWAKLKELVFGAVAVSNTK
jgi:hypothetical protein